MKKKKEPGEFAFSLEELEAELQAEMEKKSVSGIRRFRIRISDGFIDLSIYFRRYLSSFASKFRKKEKNFPALSSGETEDNAEALPENENVGDASDGNDADSSDGDFDVLSSEDEAKLRRKRYRKKVFEIVKNTLSTLAVVAAIAVLIANLWLPVLRIYGGSMTPTVEESEIVVSVKGIKFKTGDIIGFYYNNKILIKRVIAGPGSWVDIDKYGNVFVDGEKLDEPYLKEQAYGECDIELPYQVPDERYFVMGDHRSTSVDSRNRAVGCVAEDQVIGKIFFRVWPIDSFGFI